MIRKLAVLMACAALLGLAGCSLVSLKSPEKPLSTRDLNTRILTREYSAHFIAAVAQTADQIAADTRDSEVRINALRWKTAAAGQSLQAASQMVPMMSLIDSWALSIQMSEYFADGAGKSVFGRQQRLAVTLAADLTRRAEELAHQMMEPEEFDKNHRFVDDYAKAHPFESLHFTRPSVVEAWTHDTGGKIRLIDSFGTVPEALADVSDRLRMYGETGPEQLLWRSQLAAQESGIGAGDLKAALQRLDERMAQMSALANSAPKLANGMMREAGARFDSTWEEVTRDVRTERIALAGALNAERAAAAKELDEERAALAADASRIADQVIRETGDEVRRLAREALALLIVLVIVVLGAPFAAGYWVGRAQRR
ncbi:MAG TPA: hypothetical protein VK437_17985 [Steroidobacteraceae bacterium]|nr:hypothetical protein [Steroidobacteraceae bacterium]